MIGRGQPAQRGMSSVPNMAGGLNQQQENQQVAQRIPAPGLQPSTPMRPPMQQMTPPYGTSYATTATISTDDTAKC